MKLFNKTIWAITPEMLQTMMSLAKENNKTPEAIARELGKEMKDSNAASVRDGVCVIRLCGPLFRYANLLTKVCGATSYELFAQDFNKALKDPTIKAIVIDIDSPGGEVNGCSEVADIIYKARGQKPIIAYASGACCSGAYWIASSCDRILVADTAILGSIGVVSIFEKDDEDKTIEIVSSQSPNKRPNVQTEAGRAKIQAHVDALADVFITKVAQNRKISPEDVVQNFGGGDVFIGQEAVRKGLADGLSSFEEIISDLSHKEKTLMIENQTNFAATEIKQAEIERMSQVFASDKTKGKEATAQMLLAKTDLAATDILMILDTVPTAKPTTDFAAVMAKVKNPEIMPANDMSEETPDMVAKRIAAYAKGE